MSDGYLHIHFTILRPLLFEISQKRKKEGNLSVCVYGDIPKKGNVNGYTQFIASARWCGSESSFSSELLGFIVCLIVLVSQVKVTLWQSQGTTSCGQTNKWSLEMGWAQAVSCPQVCSCAYMGSSREVCNWGANMSGIPGQYFCCKNKIPSISGSQLLSEYEKTMNCLLKQICTCACTYTYDGSHFLNFLDHGTWEPGLRT